MIEEHTPDVITGTESWLTPSIYSNEILPANYYVFRKDRSDGYGEVFLAIRNNLTCETLSIDSQCEIVVCKVSTNSPCSIIICCEYRPPNCDLEYLQELHKVLESLILSHPNSMIWITGDLNLPIVDWSNNTVTTASYSTPLYTTFWDFILTYCFTQIVDFPTRGRNILDIFCTNRPAMINECFLIPGISDHEALYIQSYISIPSPSKIKKKIYLV